MIKTKGFRVSPTEVETEVLRHQEVSEAVAFAVPNVSVGEDIACAYTSVNGKVIPDAVLTQFLKTQLPNHMVPAILLHFESFPILGNAGKHDRKQIKAQHTNASASCRQSMEAEHRAIAQPRVVIGVIGDDIHIVGNRIMQLALEESGCRVFNLRTRNRPEHFVQAALEVNAHAVFVSSLNGEGEHWCADFRSRFREVGLHETLLYVGGNIVVGNRTEETVERLFRAMALTASITSVLTSAWQSTIYLWT